MADPDPAAALIEAIREGLPAGVELDEREETLLDLAGRQARDVERAEADLQERGYLVPGSQGQRVINPSVGEARQVPLEPFVPAPSVRLLDLLELDPRLERGCPQSAGGRPRFDCPIFTREVNLSGTRCERADCNADQGECLVAHRRQPIR